MTVFDNKRQTLLRALLGGLLGMAGCLLLGWLSQPGSLFGGRLTFDFTFSNVPEALGAVLCFLLWFLFGAEIGVATLPFADEGKSLLLRSLCHFGVMALTLWGWVMLNFPYEPWPGLILTYLLPFALVYAGKAGALSQPLPPQVAGDPAPHRLFPPAVWDPALPPAGL